MPRFSRIRSLIAEEYQSLLEEESLMKLASTMQDEDVVGRGAVSRHQLSDETKVVVRQYRRGGFVSNFVKKTFLSLLPVESRAMREFRVMDLLFKNGVHVAKPVAALTKYDPSGFFYKAYLVTEEIPSSENLLHFLRQMPPTSEMMEKAYRYCFDAGVEARKALAFGVAHVDLHLGNVLIDATGQVHLIDFDRAIEFEAEGEMGEHAINIMGRWRRSAKKHDVEEVSVKPFVSGISG